MNKVNEEWHRANPMPKDASFDQRVAWHLAHQKNCACREVPQKLLEEMKRRGITAG